MRLRALLRPLLWCGKEVMQLSQLAQALSEVLLVPLRLER
jgi:hypothetical protein